MQLPEYGCQFSDMWKNQLHKGRYHVRRVAGPSSGSSWRIMLHIYLHVYTCLEPLSMLFKFWGCGYSYTWKNTLLVLAVTEINTKEV